ncbi:MAG TPA: hypothetical protein VFT74_18820 [Isosphaeraceae bacterium]|nr:hypothetical protein [Isosphaeraceae bacterium]
MSVTTKDLWENSKTQVSLPPVEADEAHPADDGYVPPVSSVKLPSRGLVYPGESPLYLLESVDIKPVTAKEENILSSPVLIKKGTVLTTLMRACITNRSIDPDAMLVGDRNAILTAIRVSAYGPQYQARVTCPECGEASDHDFDLGRLSLKTLDVPPVGGPGSNLFEFKLPVCGRTARFKLMDAQTVAALDRDVEAIRKKTGQEQAVTLRLQAQVVSLSGVTDPKKLASALADLPARDSRALRIYMDQIALGVDMVQEFECSACGKSSEVEIPIGTEFFWPSEE